MQAAILVELRHPLEIASLTLPALGYGQVLVRVFYTGICGSQLGEINGIKGSDPWLPHLLGHEGAGVVLEVGVGVKRVKAGDRVVLHWMQGDGIQSSTPSYGWGDRRVNAGWVTTFNDHAVVSENRLTPIPSDTPLDMAALFGCAITTGFGVIHHDARLAIGESIAIFGVGGVGLAVVLGAAIAGAYPIIAVDVQPHKLELARRYGATHTVQSGPEVERDVLVANDGRRLDITVDNTGRVATIEAAYRLAHGQGRTILVGVPPHDAPVAIDSMPLHFGKVIKGSHGGGTFPSSDIPRYLRLQRSGRFELDGFISHRFPLERINEALDAARSGGPVRCLIEML